MKKFKDFLYDKNDILIALLILVAATLIIIWRMDAIMEYPKEIVGADDSNVEEPAQTPDAPDESEEADAPDDDGSSDADDKDDDGKDASDKDADADTGDLWKNGTLSRSVEVTVKGDSAAAAIQCLIDAELFTDYAEYQSACTALGIDHQKVSAGTFTFEKGWSKSDIAKAVNWS